MTSAFISVFFERAHTPFKFFKVDALKTHLLSANLTQRGFLVVKADQSSAPAVQFQRGIKTPNSRHVAGIGEQDRRAILVQSIVLNRKAAPFRP